MKFTLSWLKEHLETNSSLDEITNNLTEICLLYTSDAADE